MSIRDDHDEDIINGHGVKLTTKTASRANDGENKVDQKTGLDALVVRDLSLLETQGESPKCMYHLMSPSVPANTPVDPRFSTEKPPRVRMILPELNRGRYYN